MTNSSAFCTPLSISTKSSASGGAIYNRRHATSLNMVANQTFTTTESDRILKEVPEIMLGGVSSPVRAFNSVGGRAIVFYSVKAYDVDGNEYVDYIGSWGPAIVGAANDEVNAALAEALNKGNSFGAPKLLENLLAQMVVDAVPSFEMVRFINSGTEAFMSVVRVMRAFTNRQKILKFSGCYHGHADMYIVQAGSGVLALGLPDSPGVLKTSTETTLVANYNDSDSVRKMFEVNKGEIAGVILEPVVGHSVFIPPTLQFLKDLREITEQDGALLCFDEVMTGFRASYGGAQGNYGIKPDMSTFGKVIGGVLPVGAYGGRKDVMSMLSPAGPVYQNGTLSHFPDAEEPNYHVFELNFGALVGVPVRRQTHHPRNGRCCQQYVATLSANLVGTGRR